MIKHIFHHGDRLSTAMLSGLLFLLSGSAFAVDCDRESIAYYLESGFTHEQIVRLCGSGSAPDPVAASPSRPLANDTAAAYPSQQPAAAEQMRGGVPLDDLIYFKSVVDADVVEITPEALISTDEDCIQYGEEDPNGFKEEACVVTRTTIRFAGLEVVKAVSGIPFVIERELLVGGTIRRELLNTSRLSKRELKAFKAEYDLNPSQVNIPTHSGVNPEEVAVRLRAMASR